MGWKKLSKKPAPEGVELRVIIQCRCCDTQGEGMAWLDKDRGWRLESTEYNVLVEDDGNYLITHWKKRKSPPKVVKFTKKQMVGASKKKCNVRPRSHKKHKHP
jgi:hypothetical protein